VFETAIILLYFTGSL